MEGVGFLVALLGGILVAGLEGQVAQSNAGQGRQLTVFLHGDRLFVELLCLLAVARNVEEVPEREEGLGLAGVIRIIAEKGVQRGSRVFRFSLVDQQLGLAQEGIAGGYGSGVVEDNTVVGGDLVLGERGRVGGCGVEMLLLLHLRSDEDGADHDDGSGESDEDLVAVLLEGIHHHRGIGCGEGFGSLGIFRWGFRGRIGTGIVAIGHGFRWLGVGEERGSSRPSREAARKVTEKSGLSASNCGSRLVGERSRKVALTGGATDRHDHLACILGPLRHLDGRADVRARGNAA